MTALQPATGEAVWTRKGSSPGLVAARPGLVVFVEKTGVAWGLDSADGSARWKTPTNVTDVQSLRLDLNRVFIAGGTGVASLVATSGELRFDLKAKDVRDLDVAGDWLASREDGALAVRSREDGALRFRLASPEGEFGAPAVFQDGRVVLGSGSRLVRAVSSKGQFRWKFKVGARVKDRAVDYGDGKRVGVLSFEGVFYELSLGGGDMRHRVLLASRPFGPPQLREGRVWASISEDELAVIDQKTAKLIARTRFGGSFLTPPVFAAGWVLAEIASPRRIVAIETIPQR